MISKKDKDKLKLSILNFLYSNYQNTNNNSVALLVISCGFVSNTIDEHDIELTLNSLKADKLIDFEGTLNFLDIDFSISITEKGCEYCNINSNKIIKWFLNHLFDLLNLTIALIGAITGVLALILKD